MSGSPNMWSRRGRSAGVVAAAVLVALMTGCSEDDTPSDAASAAASAAEEVQEDLREIRDGIVATGDAAIRGTDTDDEGHAVAELAVTNNGDETTSYAVQVNFHDPDGDLVDVVLVTVSSVAPGETAQATARSHRELPERTTAEVATAVRH
ncbi:FxLYD domain-containing protein [Streptomyces sp. TG1A-60]|uniref:FxLYD domain-containing protein n=1 Tax=Streptomyces sp. TG1A-60 TaxID=3129111 RepID=UPI0030CCE149